MLFSRPSASRRRRGRRDSAAGDDFERFRDALAAGAVPPATAANPLTVIAAREFPPLWECAFHIPSRCSGGRTPMRRSLRRALQASAVATGAALALGVAHLVPEASAAASGGATGYASQNGGTTGGAGGAVVRATSGTQIHQALCGRASSSTPIVIQVEGTIDHGNTTKVSGASCNTAADRIELKDVSNVTIVGVGSGAVFDQLGIHVRNARNVVIQNVTV